jgi:uncharacterized membrane protein
MAEVLTPRWISGQMLLLVAFALASMHALCVVMYAARVRDSGELNYFYIPGNLTLAWFPLIFAMATHALVRKRTLTRGALAAGCAALWLLFLPNAPYVVTDLQHYEDSPLIAGWYDGLMLGAFVATGIMLGLVSLYVMHGVLTRVAGAFVAWAVVLGAMPLCGFGIYIGRIRRWNSWDAVVSPRLLLEDVARIASEPALRSEAVAMTVGFAAFLAVSYFALFTVAAMGSPRAR